MFVGIGIGTIHGSRIELPIEPVTLESTDLGAIGGFIRLASNSALNDIGAQTCLVYHRPPGTSENGSGFIYGKVPSGSLNGPRFSVSHNSGLPRLTAGFNSTGTPGAPNRVGANNTVTYGSWQHSAMTWTGSLTGTNILMYSGIGVDLTQISYSSTGNGSTSVATDASDPFYLMNRLGLDRAYVGDIAYIAIWDRVLSLPELVAAQNAGPLNVGGLLFMYANGQIYDPNGYGIQIDSRSARVFGEMPPNTNLGGEFLIQDNFDRSSVNTTLSYAEGAGDSAFINLVPRTQNNETVSNEARWQVPVARIAGVKDKRPSFRFMNYFSGAGGFWQHPWDTNSRPYFSYDLFNWTRFGSNVTINANNIQFQHSTAFTNDTVYIAAHPVRTNTQLEMWLNQISRSYPSIVQNVPSNTNGFVSGTFAPQTDELGRTIQSKPFFAFKISDPSLQPISGNKMTMVLTSGTHAGEDMGDFVWKARIDFVLGNSPEAINIRRHFEVYCYAMINAPGRSGGGFRGGFVTDGNGKNDANRNFTDLATTLEIVTLPRSKMMSDLPAKIDVRIDYHQNWQFDIMMYTNGTKGTLWHTYMSNVLSPLTITDNGPSTVGTVTNWMGTVKFADFYTTAEVGEAVSEMPNLVMLGEAWMKSIRNLVDDGELPV